MKQKFLMLLLLCIPFVAVADDAPDVTALKTDISGQTTFAAAEAKYKAAFNALKTYYSNKADGTTITNQETVVNNKINAYKTSTTETDTQTTDNRTEAQKAADLKKLEDDYEAKKANEQSLANRTLTAVTTAATGIGGMELARGLSEQKADKEAAADMAAYIETMRCTYGDGKQVKVSPDEIELPGGNNSDLMNYRTEYFALAEDLKERKTALGMKPGIESEEIIDKASTGLYDDENVGIDSGAYASLYRAQMLGSEADQAKIDEDAEASKKRVLGGAIAAGAGVVVGVAGNAIINGETGKKLKEAINNKKVGKNTQALLKKEAEALKDLRTCLKSAGVQDTDSLTFENFYPSILSVKNINCKKDLATLVGNKKASEVKASEMFDDSTNATDVFNVLATHFSANIIGKMIGYTMTNDNDTENAIKKIKTSIGSIQKQFKEAEEKDKEEANKLGINIGSITGASNGDGISALSSIFSNSNGGNVLSSFLK